MMALNELLYVGCVWCSRHLSVLEMIVPKKSSGWGCSGVQSVISHTGTATLQQITQHAVHSHCARMESCLISVTMDISAVCRKQEAQ